MAWCLVAILTILWVATSLMWRSDNKDWADTEKWLRGTIDFYCARSTGFGEELSKAREALVATNAQLAEATDGVEDLVNDCNNLRGQLAQAHQSLIDNLNKPPRKRTPWADAIEAAFKGDSDA